MSEGENKWQGADMTRKEIEGNKIKRCPKVDSHRYREICRAWDNDMQMTLVLKCVDCLRETRVVDKLIKGEWRRGIK